MSGTDTQWAQEIVQLYFVLIPVILVFQGLELQVWLARAREILNEYESDASRFAGMSGTVARRDLMQRILGCNESYPTVLSNMLFLLECLIIIAAGILGYVRYRTPAVAFFYDPDLLFLWGSLLILIITLILGIWLPRKKKKQELKTLMEKVSG